MKFATIIYSKDRAMQLHACLTSLQKHVKTMSDVFVLYKTEKYEHQYAKLKDEFENVSFVPEIDLAEQTREILQVVDYVLFVVDDTIFYRDFDLSECVIHLHKNSTLTSILGFSLRLGQNVKWSHIRNREIEQPKRFIHIGANCVCYNWIKAQCEFAYPLEVSSSIYRSSDILLLLKNVQGHPGHIESSMNRQKGRFVKRAPFLLCYKQSVAFANPVNVVRKTRCPSGRKYSYSIGELATMFDEGKRINVDVDFGDIIGVHQEVEYKFYETYVQSKR